MLLSGAPLIGSASLSDSNQYYNAAKKISLWNDPKWLRLGHYEKTFSGYTSSFRGPLFIDAEGFSSPEKELLATLNAFFSESKELTAKFGRHPQCQFLARRKWLIEKLNINQKDILACRERELWKKQLGATSATLIFAASDLGNPASSFGHTFLKLVNPDNAKNKDLLDYGVNYAADGDENEGFFYAFKGLFGMYGGRFTMLPYHQKIREYINLEGRDIWEYPLSFNAEEVDALINHLLELDSSVSPYYFISNNCSYQILVALDTVRPELHLSQEHPVWAIPIDTVKTINRKTNLIVQKKYKKSLKTDYLNSYAQLNLLQKKYLDDVIEKSTLPTDYELNNIEKAHVYETAMKYLAIKAYQTQKDFDDEKYKLSLARVALGPITAESTPKKTVSPEESHDSSALYLGYGKNLLSEYFSFKFRANFHDLEQNDAGTVPFSQNTLGAFEIRYFSELKKLNIERATILNLINTNPVTPLDKNYSWKVRVDILDQFRPDIEFGGGMSFDSTLLGPGRLVYFLTARYYKSIEHTYQAGPEILFITRPIEDLGFSIQLGYLAEHKAGPHLRFSTKFNYQITDNFDLQMQANDQKDYQLSFVKNFLL